MFWSAVEKVSAYMRAAAFVPLVFLGFAFVRRWSFWLGRFSLGDFAQTAAYDGLMLAGNTASLLVCALVVLRLGPLFRRGWIVVGSALCLVAGSAAVLWPGVPTALAATGVVLASVGFSTMFLLWFELYGALEPRKIIVAYAGSLLVNALLGAFLENYEPAMTPWMIAALPLVSAACFVAAVLSVDKNKLGRLPVWQPAVKPTIRPEMVRLLVWVVMFGLAFGMGDVLVDRASSGLTSVTGRAAFAAFMLVGMLFLARWFTLRSAYRVVLPLMIAGLSLAFFVDASMPLSQVLVSGGMEGFQTLSLIVCCGIAVRDGYSAAFSCGIVFAVETFAIQAGKALGLLAGSYELNMAVVGACVIVGLLVATSFLFKESDLVASYSEVALRTVQRNASSAELMASFASEHGLTEREADVFYLMACGKTAPQIAEELFLAGSTVRVHTSKIYQKCGVRGREEFEQLTGGLRRA